MVRSCFAAISFLAFSGWACAETPAETSPLQLAPSQLGILMKFDVPPPKHVLESMEREVSRILKPVQVNLAWRFMDASDGTESFSHVVVLRFHGSCQTQPALFGEVSTLEGETE